MAASRFSSWFLTKFGKKVVYFGAGGLSTCALLANVLPHTIFLDKYQDFVHLYKKGFTVSLNKTLIDRFQKALDLAQVNEDDRILFKPFACYGFDIFSAGTSYSKFGVIVGLPANFFYETVDDVDRSSIKLRDMSILWDTDEGKLLENSLVLSENAQLYAMAREIKFRETPKIFINTFTSILSVAGTYGLCSSINSNLNLYVRPLPIRLILYTFVSSFALGSYFLSKDFSQVYYEQKIDDELRKNPLLAEGGKEYYTKILQRNIILRKLLGKEGERAYSVLGNENYWVRHKHTPLVHRKVFFDEKGDDSTQQLVM